MSNKKDHPESNKESLVGQEKKDKSGKTLQGVVVSASMTDSAVVKVERYVKHPKYGKYVRSQKKYTAHDPGNAHKVGDKVEIKEVRPISKTKHFTIVERDIRSVT